VKAIHSVMDFDLVSRLLFPAPPPSYHVDSYPGELLCVPRSLNPQTSSPEDCVPLLLLQHPRASFLLLFLHSNFEDIGRCHYFCRTLRDQLKVHVLAAEYPSYGICPGARCDERGATESALTAFRFAREVLRWAPDRIIVMGRSVGTGPAIAIAFEYAVFGLVLVSPFLSVREVCRDSFGFMSQLIAERFPNKERMPFVSSPCLIVHGQQDVMIPVRHGQELHEACRSRKRLVSPSDLDHNANLLTKREYFLDPMADFFGLPRLCDEEMQVPSWAFDKPLKPRVPHIPDMQVSHGPAFCGAVLNEMGPETYSSTNSCTACAGPDRNQMNPNLSGRPRSADNVMVEETVSGAVEHVMAQSDPQGGLHEGNGFETEDEENSTAERVPPVLGRWEMTSYMSFTDGANKLDAPSPALRPSTRRRFAMNCMLTVQTN